MNRKILRILGIAFTVFVIMASAVVWGFMPKANLSPSDYHIGKNYEQIIQDTKPVVALFYSDWCTYCKNFMPKYKILSEVYKDKYNFVMINAENPDFEAVLKDYAISGLPTLYIIDPSIDNRVLINSALYENLRLVRIELDRYLRVRSMIKG